MLMMKMKRIDMIIDCPCSPRYQIHAKKVYQKKGIVALQEEHEEARLYIMNIITGGKDLILILFFLLIDIFCFSFFEQQLIYALLCYYIVTLFKPDSIFKLVGIALGLLLESFFYYNSFIPAAAYLLPLTAAGFLLRHFFYIKPVQCYLMLAVCIATQAFLIEPYFFQSSASIAYTLIKIFVNLVVMLIVD
jgi:hypothetical protein